MKIDGLDFDLITLGAETGELVLFLHGFPQFADSWLPIMRPIADKGFLTVAFDQRGYSPGARPKAVEDYSIDLLAADALAVADSLGHTRFHLVGHDWGGLLAWQIAAQHPERLRTLTVLSTPHTQAFLHAVKSDLDQMNRSKYIVFFRMPGHLAEKFFLADEAAKLRSLYQGKLSPEVLESNVRRLSAPGALTAALNWYRALDLGLETPGITVPTLYLWSDNDMALGEKAALATASYVNGPFHFERLYGLSHWLLEEAPDRIANLILQHLHSQNHHLSPLTRWSRG